MALKRIFYFLAALASAGCSADTAAPPSLSIGARSLCSDDDVATCINAGASTRDVAGVHVIHKQVKGEPVVALRVLIDGGDRGARQLWSESMALDLLSQEGSRTQGLVEWRTAKDALAASVGAGMGTAYGTVSAVAPIVNWNPVWDLVSSALLNPANDDYVLDFTREQDLHDYDTELDEPGTAARIIAYSRLFQGHLYDRFRETQSVAQLVTTTDIDEAWRGMLTKDRLWIVVVGDVELSDLVMKVSNAFGRIPEHHATSFEGPPRAPAAPVEARASVVAYPDSPNWQIAAYFRGPDAADPTYPAFSLGASLLGQRLFTEVREARGLAYSVGASAGLGNPSTGVISLATAAPRDALPVVAQTISDLLAGPIGADELDAARGLVRAGVLSGNRTPSAIAATLGSDQLLRGDRRGLEAYLDALVNVTEEQTRQTLARYLPATSLAAAGPDDSVRESDLLAILPGGGRGADGGADAGGGSDAGL